MLWTGLILLGQTRHCNPIVNKNVQLCYICKRTPQAGPSRVIGPHFELIHYFLGHGHAFLF